MSLSSRTVTFLITRILSDRLSVLHIAYRAQLPVTFTDTDLHYGKTPIQGVIKRIERSGDDFIVTLHGVHKRKDGGEIGLTVKRRISRAKLSKASLTLLIMDMDATRINF